MLSQDKMSNFESLDFGNFESGIEQYISENPALETPDVNLDSFDWAFTKSSVTTSSSSSTSYGKMMSHPQASMDVNTAAVNGPSFGAMLPEMDASPYSYSLAEYQEFSPIKLETSDVNFNSPLRDVVSPSMMQAVSPNTIFPGVYDTTYPSDYASPSMSNTGESSQYLLATTTTADYYDPNMLGPLEHMSSGSQPFSPKSISSNESNCGEEKTFANLDNATLCYQQQQQQQLQAPIQIKQEVIEDFPTVLSEFLNDYHAQQQQQQLQQSHQQQSSESASLNVLTTTDPMFSQSTFTPTTSSHRTQSPSFAQYQAPQAYSSIPVTIQGAVQQHQQLTTSVGVPNTLVTLSTSCPTHSTPSTSSSASSRRRVVASTAPKQVGGAGVTKKARMSKREKQLMMEAQIQNYLKEKDDLSATISLLSRKIEFCKKYLSENVKPFIQHQQQQQLFQQVSL